MKRTARNRKTSRARGRGKTATPPAEPVNRITPVAQPADNENDDTAPSDGENLHAPEFMIVGVGASAGGLEACTQLLEGLPASLGMAIVVVQHLAPLHESLLPELLGAHCKMKVVQVYEGIEVRPNCVYVIPPNTHMRIAAGVLHLQARPEDRTQHMPVDSFFGSLADYAENRCIGIVLSGTASDGAIGVREIKAAGGITIVQDPKTAKSEGMPRAALGTGTVDLVLAPAEIAKELVRIAGHPLVQAQARKAGGELDGLEKELPQLFTLLRNVSGVDFTHYKLPTIRRRLHRRMVLHKIQELGEYIKLLQQDAGEVDALYQDILIHVTRFFREPESFAVLAEKALSGILANRPANAPIRIWVPGCATGEEAYSVAMVLHEMLEAKHKSKPVQIFGTDVSENAITQARMGVYPESITSDVSPQRLQRFFTRIDGGYRINKSTRDMCIFARQDLTRDPPFSKLDLVLCRNVLIYLGAALQKRLMAVFHYALKPTGFLMLGSAETVGTGADYFSIVDKRYKLYAKKAAVSDHANVEHFQEHPKYAVPPARQRSAPEARTSSIVEEANHIILSRYSPAGVVVDEDFQILQFRGQTGKFLEPAPGEPSLSLLKMAREGLLYGIRTALHEARKLGESVRREGLRLRTNGDVTTVAVDVEPLRGQPGERHYLILFEETGGDKESGHGAGPAADGKQAGSIEGRRKGGKAGVKGRRGKLSPEARRVNELERELSGSREYLQSIIQDLEAANEELQSANEEILSANEELQSTNEELDTAKEELQSTNEEVNTVNEELHARNDELSRVNSDLTNLLASVQIAIVMVSNDMRVRRFTPMAQRVLNLIPSDMGRPISDIKPNIDCPGLESLIQESIDQVSIKEFTCQDRSGRSYSVRVRPYKNLDNEIDGAVIVLYEEQRPGGQLLTTDERAGPRPGDAGVGQAMGKSAGP